MIRLIILIIIVGIGWYGYTNKAEVSDFLQNFRMEAEKKLGEVTDKATDKMKKAADEAMDKIEKKVDEKTDEIIQRIADDIKDNTRVGE